MNRTLLFSSLFGLMLISVILVRYFLERRELPTWTKSFAIAHRGLHNPKNAPENSMAAFKDAVKNGYAIEFDVMLSQDKEVVVFHDDTLERMTGVQGLVENTPLKTLKTLNLAGTSQTIPTLKELLETIKGQVPLYLEIKNEGPAHLLEQKVAELLDQYAGPFIILCFNVPTLQWFQEHRPNFLRAQNVDLVPGNMFKNIGLMLSHSFKAAPDLVIYDGALFPRSLTKFFSRLIVPLTAYNVTSDQDFKRLQNISYNFIFDHIRP